MRTELKIGVTVLLVVSVMVLVYIVFFPGGAADKPKQREDLGSIPAGADANRSSPRLASRSPSPTPRATPARTATPEPVPTLAPIALAPPRATEVPTIAESDLRASRPPESGVIPPPVLGTPRPAEANRLTVRPEPTPIYIREPSGVPTIPPPVVDDRTAIPPARSSAEANAALAARPGLLHKADGKDYYVVQRDDQGYWGIAAKASVYGDGRRWDIIAKANPSVDPARLQVGQELVIPPLVRTSEPRTAALSATRPAGAHELYTVKSGDNLESIAKAKYNDGSLWKDIAKANPGLDPSRLRIGQEIVIPPAADVRRAAASTAPSVVTGATTRPALARHTAPSPAASSTTERPRPTPAAAGGWD